MLCLSFVVHNVSSIHCSVFVFAFVLFFGEVFKGDDCLVLLFIILYFLLEAFALHVLLFRLLFLILFCFDVILCGCTVHACLCFCFVL